MKNNVECPACAVSIVNEHFKPPRRANVVWYRFEPSIIQCPNCDTRLAYSQNTKYLPLFIGLTVLVGYLLLIINMIPIWGVILIPLFLTVFFYTKRKLVVVEQMSVAKRLKERLLSEGLQLNPPCTVDEIESFEKRYKVILPADLREYFLCFNGTGLGNFGDSGYAFASLEECTPWDQEYDLTAEESNRYRNCFVIADYMIWCWGYIIDLTPKQNTIYNVPDVKHPENIVGLSFTDFIENYLADSDEIL